MRRVMSVLVAAVAFSGLLVGHSEAVEVSGVPTAPTATAGEVRFETASCKHCFPTIGPFRFVGAFHVGGRSFVGTVHGSTATLDTTVWPYRYEPVELASGDGRLAGSCTIPHDAHVDDPSGFGTAEARAMRCELQIVGGAPQELTLWVAAAPHSSTGDGNHTTARATHAGTFVGREV